MSLATVHIGRNDRGGWEVALSDPRERVVCETLDDARRVGYLCAARAHASELVVRDAYHRVLHRELIGGQDRPDRVSRET
jgi:hypothetical protein